MGTVESLVLADFEVKVAWAGRLFDMIEKSEESLAQQRALFASVNQQCAELATWLDNNNVERPQYGLLRL